MSMYIHPALHNMHTKVTAFPSQQFFSIRLKKMLIQPHQNRSGNNERGDIPYKKIYIHDFDLGMPIKRATLKKIYKATNST